MYIHDKDCERIGMKKFNCYCISLRRAANAVTHLYDHCLDPVGLSVTQYSLLSNLKHMENCSITELAAFIGLERTTVVRTLQPLLERGLISDSSASGQRNRILSVTESGNQVLKQCRELWGDAQAKVEEHIGKDGAEKLLELLTLISDV